MDFSWQLLHAISHVANYYGYFSFQFADDTDDLVNYSKSYKHTYARTNTHTPINVS